MSQNHRDSLHMSSQYNLSQSVSFTQLDDEAVLLNLESGSYFGLNHVGVFLINELQKGASSDSAIETIAKEYNAPKEQVENDINALLKEMLQQNLLIKR